MTMDEVAAILEDLEGVHRTARDGLIRWSLRGRLVARTIDAAHIVMRSEFGPRDALVAAYPETFSVPGPFERHMMIVANLPNGDSSSIEDALVAAWALQRRAH